MLRTSPASLLNLLLVAAAAIVVDAAITSDAPTSFVCAKEGTTISKATIDGSWERDDSVVLQPWTDCANAGPAARMDVISADRLHPSTGVLHARRKLAVDPWLLDQDAGECPLSHHRRVHARLAIAGYSIHAYAYGAPQVHALRRGRGILCID